MCLCELWICGTIHSLFPLCSWPAQEQVREQGKETSRKKENLDNTLSLSPWGLLATEASKDGWHSQNCQVECWLPVTHVSSKKSYFWRKQVNKLSCWVPLNWPSQLLFEHGVFQLSDRLASADLINLPSLEDCSGVSVLWNISISRLSSSLYPFEPISLSSQDLTRLPCCPQVSTTLSESHENSLIVWGHQYCKRGAYAGILMQGPMKMWLHPCWTHPRRQQIIIYICITAAPRDRNQNLVSIIPHCTEGEAILTPEEFTIHTAEH